MGSFLTPILESIWKPIMDIRGIVLTHILNTFLIYIRDGAFELEQTCYTLMEGMGYLKVDGVGEKHL